MSAYLDSIINIIASAQESDKYNHVDFEPVMTTDLKVAVKLRDGKSGGVIEWKVN